ncbi:hypothetical protein PR003_g29679 [Phytophthora rubi]|uniref:Uncharacterized protein n=1 Tax=Phytophthora rubi TaxID=129364 RepID=A0A6A3H8L0_9STRA|nr:hypothetical protein PR002_g28561 [Phytophthora rubi]KAE8966036.1 hypothetical protein PR001_g28532 [Phytophthora rubi]KAE9274205.1 hypothetical protein PR003_g29679 [Phytophthora rubi]
MSLTGRLSGAGQRLFDAKEYIQDVIQASLEIADDSEQLDLVQYLDDLEQIQRQLNATTKRLVSTVRSLILEKASGGSHMKTEQQSKLTIEVVKSESDSDAETGAEMELKPYISFVEYTDAAQKAMDAVNTDTDDKDARNVISHMNDGQLTEWSKTVEEKALFANRVFLKRLKAKGIKKDTAVAFVMATTLATSLVASRRVKLPKRVWLIQFHSSLYEIATAAESSRLKDVLLAPVEKCQIDVENFMQLTALDSMSSIVASTESKGRIEALELLRVTQSLLLELMYNCESYFEDPPRTESKWVQFGEIIKSLANWMRILSDADVPYDGPPYNIDPLLKFSIVFPGRVSPDLFRNWVRMTGIQVMAAPFKRARTE